MINTKQNALYAKWKLAHKAEMDGQLPKNSVIATLFNKVTKQVFVDTFKYRCKIVDRYKQASTMIGGLDEIINVEFNRPDQFDMNIDWVKEEATPKVNAIWAGIEFEDKYYVTIRYDLMARAFLEESAFGSLLAALKGSMYDAKQNEWYERIIAMHKQIPLIIEVEDTSEVGTGKLITKVLQDMLLPNTKYNINGRINAYEMEDLQVTWNLEALNEFQWNMARMFHLDIIKNVYGLLGGNYVNYQDDDIICVIDTNQSIYIGQKLELTNYQDMPSIRKMNHFLHETYTIAMLPFTNSVIIKKKSKTEPEPDKTTVVVDKEAATVVVGATTPLVATIENGVGETTVTSSDDAIATVVVSKKTKAASTITVTGVKAGTATITITNNEVSATSTITVEDKPLTELSTVIKTTSVGELADGEDATIKAAVISKNATKKAVLDADFDIKDNDKTGKANAVGKGLYTGTVAITYTVKAESKSVSRK